MRRKLRGDLPWRASCKPAHHSGIDGLAVGVYPKPALYGLKLGGMLA